MRGRRWALLVPALVLMVGVAGCGEDSVSQAPGAQGTPGAGTGSTPSGEYLSTAVTENGEARALVKGTTISLTFRDGSVSARAGCNTMSGPVSFDGDTLVVDSLAQTEMGCPGDGRHEQDEFVAAFLTDRPTYALDGGNLTLTTATITMAFGPREVVQPDLPLAGTRWEVTHVTQGPAAGAPEDPNAAVSAGAAPPGAFLVLDDGRITGKDGCNTFRGTATVEGDTITFGPLASTRMACPGVRGTQAVLAALTGEVTWRIDYHVLMLTSDSGAGLQLQAGEAAATAHAE